MTFRTALGEVEAIDTEYLTRVLQRLRPFVRDHVIHRTRLERVLGTLQTPSDAVRPEVERLLRRAGIRIDEDVVEAVRVAVVTPRSPATTPVSTAAEVARPVERPVWPEEAAVLPEGPGARQLGPNEVQRAVAVARARIAADRHVLNHAAILLNAEQEVGLATLLRGRSGQPLEQGGYAQLSGEAHAAAECLFLHNQRLVHSIAKQFPQTGMTYEDLVQHGMTGLVRAVELFDPAQGHKFSTYATWWIRQAISRGLANEGRLIRLPVHMVEKLNKVWATRRRLMVGAEPPTLFQLAKACQLEEAQVLECLRLGPPDLPSLDMKIGDGEATLADVVDKADPQLDPYHLVEYVLLQEDIGTVLNTLSEREAGVISMRFGLTTGEEMTLDEIGKVYGVTRERIRQIESKTMSKLRHRSRTAVLEAYSFGGRCRAKPKSEVDEAINQESEQAAATA